MNVRNVRFVQPSAHSGAYPGRENMSICRKLGSSTGARTALAESLSEERRHPATSPHRLLFQQRSIPRSSRTRPAEAPAGTRKSPQRGSQKTRSCGESPPIPAQPASTMTGLSCRRSRVRVVARRWFSTRHTLDTDVASIVHFGKVHAPRSRVTIAWYSVCVATRHPAR